jgi:type II secretion system protein D
MCTRRWESAVAVAVVVVIIATVAIGTTPAPAGAAEQAEGVYRSYAVRHVDVDEVRAHLEQLLSDTEGPVEIVVDSKRNAVLIRGGEETQRVARQLIEAVDRPEARRDSSPESGRGRIQIYDFNGTDLQRFVADLHVRYAGRDDVRVSANMRAGQLVLFASPDEHRSLQREMGTLLRAVPTPISGGTGGDKPVDDTPSGDVASRFIELSHLSVGQFEQSLVGMFGARLTKVPQVTSGLRGYLLSGSDGRRLELGINDRFGQISLRGTDSLVAGMSRVIAAIDAPRGNSERITRIVPLRRADPEKLREAFRAYRGDTTGLLAPPRGGNRANGRAGEGGAQYRTDRAVQPAEYRSDSTDGGIRFVSMLFQDGEGEPTDSPDANSQPPEELDAATADRIRELGEDVEIEMLSDLDVIILRGADRDVTELIEIIQEIERISAQNVPRIEVYGLDHVSSDSLGLVIAQVETNFLAGRQGQANVRSLSKPNAMLVIGWGEAMDAMLDLIARLDQPVDPQAQLQVFRLKYTPAAAAQQTVTQFFTNRQGLGPKVVATADTRSNALIVQAGPRDMQEVAMLIARIDTPGSDVVNQIRVIRLNNALAGDVGPILQQAITAVASGGQGAGRSTILEILTLDAEGRKLVESGMLSDVRITPDPHTNTLVISAPAESMELVVALVGQLDALPSSMAQLKVFRIVNGDARSLVLMLQTLLGGQTTGPQLAVAPEEASLAPLRFSIDQRSNSIIASGSAGELKMVEAILLRLDESDVDERRAEVYRLRNAPALDVAVSVNELLRSERVLTQASAGSENVYELIEREVIVVPEPISNSLIISASDRFFDRIMELVKELDEQPPQVVIQVLIAEIELGNVEEFGIELGIQDSVLFDRSLLGELVTTTTSSSDSTAQGVVTSTNQTIVAASNQPGFDFNNNPLGNSGSEKSLDSAADLAGQALSSFGVGRVNTELGFGGLVLAASNESISVLLRALSDNRRMDILSRPQITTLDNQAAYVQVGERVPYITDVVTTNFGQNNVVELVDVGLILGVTPRINPDGMIVMEVDAQKSELGPIEDGIPIFVNIAGDEVLSPRIDIIEAQTTVSAADGQTIVLGGLITESDRTINRRVPYLADIPILGHLFRYDMDAKLRTELLIVLTPRVVRNEDDMEKIKQEEAARMSWCLADVQRVHGATGIYGTDISGLNVPDPAVIYPVDNPRGVLQEGDEPRPAEVLQPGPKMPGPPGRAAAPAFPGPVPMPLSGGTFGPAPLGVQRIAAAPAPTPQPPGPVYAVASVGATTGVTPTRWDASPGTVMNQATPPYRAVPQPLGPQFVPSAAATRMSATTVR